MNFLDYPFLLQDAKTIWHFCERLSKTGKDQIIWDELQIQMELKGIKVENGYSYGATFITSDPGHEKREKPCSDKKKRISRHNSFTKKNNRILFCYVKSYHS